MRAYGAQKGCIWELVLFIMTVIKYYAWVSQGVSGKVFCFFYCYRVACTAYCAYNNLWPHGLTLAVWGTVATVRKYTARPSVNYKYIFEDNIQGVSKRALQL
jgi:hypothetical protein